MYYLIMLLGIMLMGCEETHEATASLTLMINAIGVVLFAWGAISAQRAQRAQSHTAYNTG